MLATRFRFKGHGSLRYTHARGEVYRSQYFIVKTTKNPRRSEPRFAVVVSKKTLKSAVGRNRIRRRVYEELRHAIPFMREPRDVIVIVLSAEVRQMPIEKIRASLHQLLTEANIISRPPTT